MAKPEVVDSLPLVSVAIHGIYTQPKTTGSPPPLQCRDNFHITAVFCNIRINGKCACGGHFPNPLLVYLWF